MTKLTNEKIKEIMLANGFKIKDGQDDLMPYVYAAARAIEEAVKPIDFVNINYEVNQMKTEMLLQQAIDMANSAHASEQEKLLVKEVLRLQRALVCANAMAERFERAWYLRGHTLEKVMELANESLKKDSLIV